ncbi:hypothetical protein RB195_011052 [Necator americanus]|uniref:Uncharacterized protein n=1 Tax=Necator americanus TaxID=51031 RepID=A0ABR1D0L9_NECAM
MIVRNNSSQPPTVYDGDPRVADDDLNVNTEQGQKPGALSTRQKSIAYRSWSTRTHYDDMLFPGEIARSSETDALKMYF